jgi:hypothetical protein
MERQEYAEGKRGEWKGREQKTDRNKLRLHR